MLTDLVINDTYLMVEDDQTLNELCDLWQACDFLAMDTEFIRTSTFYPHVGLIQINAGAGNYLIDPLKINDWEAFKALMVNPEITKIFHSCSEDLQVFMAKMDLIPAPIFDTQIAAAFINKGFGSSYHTLVMDSFTIDLPKGETRSDWLQRPLKENQCHYAAQDVAYLPTIYLEQRQALVDSGRLQWFQEECEVLLNIYRKEMSADFSDYFLNIKGAWQLSGKELHLLKQLAQWRELRARKRDKPRNWIIKDRGLLDIARKAPTDIEQLSIIDDLGRSFIHHEGEEIITMIISAQSEPIDSHPEVLPRPLDGKDKSRLKKVQKAMEEKALELDFPIEILVRKRWLISALQNLKIAEKNNENVPLSQEQLLPEELTGWRKALLMPDLLDAMR